jgi:hypothetical protein
VITSWSALFHQRATPPRTGRAAPAAPEETAREEAFTARQEVKTSGEGERPKPRRINRRGCRLHDPADDDAIGKHIEIILFPLA